MMETILNYLENMFSSLPQTEEVLRAKRELAAMMEDKYNELLEEGRTDNEAVGIVISEFGNLKELSAELGIDEIYYGESVGLQGRFVHDTEVKKYMEQTKKSSIWIGLATMLCIFSPILLLILGGLQNNGHNVTDVMLVCFGLGALFLMIAAAVGLFIFHGTMLDKYDYLKKENIRISSESVSYLRTYQEKTENSYLIRLIVGVIMCIISVIPLLVVGVTYEDNELYGSLAVSALLFIVGIAVFMFITALDGLVIPTLIAGIIHSVEIKSLSSLINYFIFGIVGYCTIRTALYLCNLYQQKFILFIQNYFQNMIYSMEVSPMS